MVLRHESTHGFTLRLNTHQGEEGRLRLVEPGGDPTDEAENVKFGQVLLLRQCSESASEAAA